MARRSKAAYSPSTHERKHQREPAVPKIIPMRALFGVAVLAALVACSPSGKTASTTETAAKATTPTAASSAPEAVKDVVVTDASFGCIRNLRPVRGFYVGNLLGDIDATIAVANSETGGVYPPGSVVQLIPTEVMVKHQPGFDPTTRDWEFLDIDVTAQGQTIRTRGAAQTVNRFGGNCFDCHKLAQPQWDLICEETHGCAPIPLTREMFRGLQNTDPRCPAVQLPPEQVEALAQLAKLSSPPPAQN
jgi:hypothetical protein